MTEDDIEILEALAQGWAENGMYLPGNVSIGKVQDLLAKLGATRSIAVIDEQLSYYDRKHYKSDWKVNVHDIP